MLTWPARSKGPDKVNVEITVNAVLGIDAAWSEGKPSGVALIRQLQDGRWECVAVAPSYGSFLGLAEGSDVDWGKPPKGGLPKPQILLEAAGNLLKDADVTLVTVDMPISIKPFTTRRNCDNAISKAFWREKCGTHSINKKIPVRMFENLRVSLDSLGYHLVTQTSRTAKEGATIEVYPHPAVVRLLNLDHRLQYKVDKSNDFWPGKSLAERREMLRANFHRLRTGLATEIDGIPADLIPTDAYLRSRRSLKRYEVALDALVCAWVGACYLEGRAEPFGDADAAIWVPTQDHRLR